MSDPQVRTVREGVRKHAFHIALVCMVLLLSWKGYEAYQQDQKKHEEWKAVRTAELGEESELEKTMDALTLENNLRNLEHANDDVKNGSKVWVPAQCLLSRAFWKLMLGRYAACKKDLEQAQQEYPKEWGIQMHAAELAPLFAQRGYYDDAVPLWEAVLRDFPQNERMRYDYGVFLYKTKNADLRDSARAVTLVRPGFKDVPEESWYRRDLSEALAANGQFAEALPHAEAAIVLAAKEHEEMLRRLEASHERFKHHATPESSERRRKEKELMEAQYARYKERLEASLALFREGKALPPSKKY